jgi:outer membrane autotransporter protein
MRSQGHSINFWSKRFILCAAVLPFMGAGVLAADITITTPTTGPVGTPADEVITVTASGSVTTDSKPAVKLQGSDVLVNYGVISATNDNAVKRSNKDSSAYHITNRGRIESGTNPAINLKGGGSESGDVLINSGTIIGGAGEAIRMGAGDDLVQLETGSSVIGNIHGGGGYDSMVLSGEGSFDYDMLNFRSLIKEGAGTWTLTGNVRHGVSGGGGPIDGQINAGTLSLLGTFGEMGGGDSLTVNPGGTLIGTGTLNGNLQNNGIVSPGVGSALGQFTVRGNYAQSSAGTLNINVRGTQSSSLLVEPGLLFFGPGAAANAVVPGAPGANLAGTLNVTWLGGYAPSGTLYPILQSGTPFGPVGPVAARVAGTSVIEVGNPLSITGRFETLNLNPTAIINFDLAYVEGSGGVGFILNAANGVAPLAEPAFPASPLDAVFLILRRNSYLSVSGTQNQRRVGANLDLLVDSATGDLRNVFDQLDMLDLAQIQKAFDLMSPEVYGAYSDIAFDNAWLLQESLERRLAELRFTYTGTGLGVASLMDFAGPALAENTIAPAVASDATAPKGKADARMVGPCDNHWSVFASGYGNFVRQGSRLSHPGFDYTTAGAVVGADYRISKNVLFGLSTGFATTTADLDQLGSHADVEGISVGGYASFFDTDGAYGNAIFSYGFNSYDADRNIAFGGLYRRAHSETDGGQINASIGGGKDFHWGPLTIGPSGVLQYVHLNVDGFTEEGADSLNLLVKDQEQDSLRLAVGGRLSHAFHFCWGSLAPEFRAKYLHEFLDDSRGITSQFYGSGAGAFTVHAGDRSRDSALLGAGLTATVKRNIQAYVNYDANLGSKDYNAHGVMGGFRIKF